MSLSDSSLSAQEAVLGLLGDLRPPYVLLEDRLDPGSAARLYADPVDVVRCDDAAEVDAAFRRIEDGLSRGLHAAGLMSYELGYALEPRLGGLMPEPRDAPLLWFGLFEAPRSIAPDVLDAAFADLAPPSPIESLRYGNDRARHVAAVNEVLRLIGAGDVYQANLTFPLRFDYAGDPLALYGALRVRQPVAHGGVVAVGDMTVLSVSPELWVEVRGERATTRPMKGTSARGEDSLADQAAREALAASPKQRAENLMIVDLLRNDLARVSVPGSVRVSGLFSVETYPSFHAMTSTVTAQLAPDRSLLERIAALFPCGSIVGAPKIRAAEIIRGLEREPRGLYTGSMGWIGPGGDMAFNVAIRTAVLTPGGAGRYGVGGGIVADSDPDAEYDEALLKGRVLTDLVADYELLETFRWSRLDGFVRLPLHLERLTASAAQLGFAFDAAEAAAELTRLAGRWADGPSDRRVRLALARGGRVNITEVEIGGPQPATIFRVGVAAERLDAGDAFLRHKTSRRDVYERAFAAALAEGLDEAIFLNRRGEVAEATRHSVFARIGGRLATPPLTSGVLPGVLRRQLIEAGEAAEARLTLDDLRRADGVFLGNSLHGLRAATLQDLDV